MVSKGVPIVNWEESFFNVNGELRRNNANIFLSIYPVGSIYISTSSTNPGTLFGGTWSQITNRFLLAAGSSYTAGNTGGSSTHSHTTAAHTLTIDEIPSHEHNNARGVTSVSPGSSSTPNTAWANGSSFAWSTKTDPTGGGESHSHGNTGSSSSLPPYLVVYIWKRTA